MKDNSFVDHQFLHLLKACAKKIAHRFGIRRYRIDLFDIDDPERRSCRGLCYPDGEILLNLRKRPSRKFDTIESAMDTVIHELAHLTHNDHSREFWLLHKKMKTWFFKNLY